MTTIVALIFNFAPIYLYLNAIQITQPNAGPEGLGQIVSSLKFSSPVRKRKYHQPIVRLASPRASFGMLTMPREGSSRSIDNLGDADERLPLLGNGLQPASEVRRLPDSTIPDGSNANLTIILPCLMLSVFLVAFDVTVVAAVYSIMSIYVSVSPTDRQRIRF